MQNATLVIMAAGLGARYGGLKQLEPVGLHEELIIDYSIYDALAAGFTKIVFVIREEIQKEFHRKIGKTIENHCEIAYAFQRISDIPKGMSVANHRTRPWGTAHAVLSSHTVVDTRFAVINADDFYGRTSFQSLYGYLSSIQEDTGLQEYCMVGYRLENTLSENGHVARGICALNRDNYLTMIQERTRIIQNGHSPIFTDDGVHWKDIPADSVASMNMWGFTPRLFPELEKRFHEFLEKHYQDTDQPEYYLPEVVGNLIQVKTARVKVLQTNERWYGVTYPADRENVQFAIRQLSQNGIYPQKLWDNHS